MTHVILSDCNWVPRPERESIAGAGKAIDATFEQRHCNPETGQYVLGLREPAPVPGNGEWTTLNVPFVGLKNLIIP